MDQNVDLKLLIECVIGRSSSGPCDLKLWKKLVSKRRMDSVFVIQLRCFYFERHYGWSDFCMDARVCV